VLSSDKREGIIRASSEFWVTIFDHNLKDNEYKNAIMSRLAVLGIYREKNG
jgi:hypothetical protein